jgi:hypothetical protein
MVRYHFKPNDFKISIDLNGKIKPRNKKGYKFGALNL